MIFRVLVEKSKVKRRLVFGREDEDGKDVAVAGVATVPVFPSEQMFRSC